MNKLWFSFIHNHFLVYNCSWEDPAVDRELLQLDSDSRVLMITGAGDNTLDYLLDRPALIHCVDLNFRQNALLNFKRSLFLNNEQGALKQIFLQGNIRPALELNLNEWDDIPSEQTEYLNTFFSRNVHQSFYRSGTTGFVSELLRRYIQKNQLQVLIHPLFEFSELSEQRKYYDSIEEFLWQGSFLKMLNHPLSTSLLGVPIVQLKLSRNRQSLIQYLRVCLKQVFSYTLGRDNYFWKVYFKGAYDDYCAPNYILDTHFDTIRSMAQRIQTYTCTLLDHLRSSTQTFTHFVLLDHMDWFSRNDAALDELWKLIQLRSEPGAKVLFRTVNPDRGFLPERALSSFSFQDELTEALHRFDRVGTYRGTHLGILK
jgi:S-adenosylmethionine-diacylglycerol 3-amino-3-carboxypropyl transferase